jgi:hypothetical protein
VTEDGELILGRTRSVLHAGLAYVDDVYIGDAARQLRYG